MIGAGGNSPFFIFLIFFLSVKSADPKRFLAQALTIEPSHDRPCVVGDAWAEECVSCVCLEGGKASCKSSFCATRLRRELDDCKEGEITHVECNTCRCKNNTRVCTKNDCGKERQPHGGAKQNHAGRSYKKREKRARRVKG
ncbi:uncharacterized protein LOC124299578 [Neodiprion virginianus]|uniref:Uncharacterized protein LOC107228168 n=1 Tax=Neodiprion lecontei TaxID=441921 RepID=A0A6J0CGB1_NEOLC|nr:uncharacterized protein LOC107228168 [Neodiprion lecontei]XP_046608803.1 uncharacterized protein LOC124299578 [Neodiprion virginianus]